MGEWNTLDLTAITLPLLSAIIALFGNTVIQGRGPLWRRLTPVGYLALIVLVVSVPVSLASAQNSHESSRAEREYLETLIKVADQNEKAQDRIEQSQDDFAKTQSELSKQQKEIAGQLERMEESQATASMISWSYLEEKKEREEAVQGTNEKIRDIESVTRDSFATAKAEIDRGQRVLSESVANLHTPVEEIQVNLEQAGFAMTQIALLVSEQSGSIDSLEERLRSLEQLIGSDNSDSRAILTLLQSILNAIEALPPEQDGETEAPGHRTAVNGHSEPSAPEEISIAQ